MPRLTRATAYRRKQAKNVTAALSACHCEMAGDPAGALLLLGMRVDALSMSPASLARVKLVIGSFTLQRARELLDAALRMEDGFAIHRLMNGSLKEAGLTTSPSA